MQALPNLFLFQEKDLIPLLRTALHPGWEPVTVGPKWGGGRAAGFVTPLWLVGGWDPSFQGSQPSACRLQTIWAPCPCAQPEVISFTWVGVLDPIEELKDVLFYVFLEGEPGPCPIAVLLFGDCSSLVSAFPPLHNYFSLPLLDHSSHHTIILYYPS